MSPIPPEIIARIAALGKTTGQSLHCADVTAKDNELELVLGVVHEWMAFDDGDGRSQEWFAPLGVMIALAWRMIRTDENRLIAWIGRRTWPTPRSLLDAHGSRDLLARSLFIDAQEHDRMHGHEHRLWAAQQALACDGVMVVVYDASGFDMVASRRMQLAAARSIERPHVLALAVRPWSERAKLSASTTRWAVYPHDVQCGIDMERSTCPQTVPIWRAQLLRGRGAIGGANDGTERFFRATWSWSGG